MAGPFTPRGPLRSPESFEDGREPQPVERTPRPDDLVPIANDSSTPPPVRVPRESPPPAGAPAPPGGKIRAFSQQLGSVHEDNWKRTPNTTGTGAIHVKSFHCKLTGDSLTYLDQQINEWLDAHPQYEVKQVTTSIGLWTGKLKEPNLIVNVWV
jgi:hypothetical protein